MSDPVKSGDLASAITNIGTSLTRASVAVATLPSYLLPEQSRGDAVNAATTFVNSVGALHMSIAKAALSGVTAAVQELNKAADSVQQTAKAPAAPVVKR
ncbi:MAG: hypothetical protein WCI67_16205 [Chloroflexales bacterium]